MIVIHPRWYFTLADLVAFAREHGLVLSNRRTASGRVWLVLEAP